MYMTVQELIDKLKYFDKDMKANWFVKLFWRY